MSAFGGRYGSRGRAGGGRGGGGGRGAYYKAKYGGGGNGGNHEEDNAGKSSGMPIAGGSQTGWGGGTSDMLFSALQQLDGQQYPRYHSVETVYSAGRGGWSYNSLPGGPFYVSIPKTQSDPFAPPSRVRVFVPAETARFPPALYSTPDRTRALSDYCLRAFHTNCAAKGADEAQHGEGWGGPKGGDLKICAPGQNVLDQSAVRVDRDGNVTAQFTVSLPARGRSILGQVAAKIFGKSLPEIVHAGLLYSSHDPEALQHFVLAIEDQADMRRQLNGLGLVSFIGNGSILPRSSGANDSPMHNEGGEHPIVAFEAPPSTLVKLRLKNADQYVYGMGIPSGVTVIVGGGFHGKSTLLNAIQLGVYDKVPGDGREFIVTVEDSVKIKSEDGRMLHSRYFSFHFELAVRKVNMDFTTTDASGSTSQAANVTEALEQGARVLIFDEDTCATNFMIRDSKMAALVNAEPITPFISRVADLSNDAHVSSILVVGGAGDYLNCADLVLKMDCYRCYNATQTAKEIIADPRFVSQVPPCAPRVADWTFASRFVQPHVLSHILGSKCSVRALEKVSCGDIELRLHGLDQLVTQSQTCAILAALYRMAKSPENVTLKELVDQIESDFDSFGVADTLNSSSFDGSLARPRRFEIAAAVSRLRAPGVLIKKSA